MKSPYRYTCIFRRDDGLEIAANVTAESFKVGKSALLDFPGRQGLYTVIAKFDRRHYRFLSSESYRPIMQ